MPKKGPLSKPKKVKRCEHDRIRYQCGDCKGKGICQHNRTKYTCKDCSGKGRCQHGRMRYVCKDCGGKGICEHKKQKAACKQCRKSRNVVVVAAKIEYELIDITSEESSSLDLDINRSTKRGY